VNPVEGVKVKIPKTRGWHTWTDDEIAQYRAGWPLGTQQRLVMESALEAVSRRAEVVRLGPQHVRSGRIHIERVHRSKPLSDECACSIKRSARQRRVQNSQPDFCGGRVGVDIETCSGVVLAQKYRGAFVVGSMRAGAI
jgi:hypothetical protein